MSNEKEAAPASRPWDDLRRIADEVRLKLHLAGMEARDRWRSIEPRLVELEHKIERGGEKAADVVGDQLSSLTGALRDFAEALKADLDKRKPPVEKPADQPAAEAAAAAEAEAAEPAAEPAAELAEPPADKPAE